MALISSEIEISLGLAGLLDAQRRPSHVEAVTIPANTDPRPTPTSSGPYLYLVLEPQPILVSAKATYVGGLLHRTAEVLLVASNIAAEGALLASGRRAYRIPARDAWKLSRRGTRRFLHLGKERVFLVETDPTLEDASVTGWRVIAS